ncbi:hypothetical protein GCM10022280_04120 [Sphingomonas swuensis]|uniref:DUF2339 domain-containing protein n=1 Tax=Sphingomonas swuensis TaxID=977800 RepID=A0ABP7SDK8_9SPHN
MTTMLVLLLLGYVIYLDRRVGKLQQWVAVLETRSWDVPRAQPTAEWAPEPEPADDVEPEVEAPGRLLRAETRPGEQVVADEPEYEPEADFEHETTSEAGTEPRPEPEPVLAADRSRTMAWDDQRPVRGLSFEELFGRKLPIWGGGITLAVAGFLIVKYSIDAGLFSPGLRVIAGLLFGLALVAGAEWARRREDFVQDERVAQALAGAGIASLYGAVLVAANVYQLIGPGLAMVGMAAVTALALALATRFGSPSALLGLAGGLAAPALIGSAEPNVPLLMVYLALAVGGLTAVSRRQRWAWLGIGALLGGFGWSLVLLLTGALDTVSTLALGLFVLLLGLVLPGMALADGNRGRLRLVAAAIAAVQIAALVATGGFTPLNWGLFALLAAAVQWLRRHEPELALLPPLALTVGLLLAFAWPEPSALALALVAAGGLLIFGLPAARRLWTAGGGLVEAGQLAALGLALPLLWHWQQASNPWDAHPPSGLLGLLAGAALAALAWLGWSRPERQGDSRFALLCSTSAACLGLAAADLLPLWAVAIGVAAIAAAVLEVRRQSADPRLEQVAWAFLFLASLALVPGPFETQLNRAMGSDIGLGLQGLLRWLAVAAAAALFAWRASELPLRKVAQGTSLLLAYVGLAQLWPADWLPLLPPLLLLAALLLGRKLRIALLPALASAALLILGWALWPLASWAIPAGGALFGDPLLASDLPVAGEALWRLVLPGAALLLVRHRAFRILGGTLVLVGAHSLFKQLFGLASLADFEARGLAERLVWDGLLLAIAALAWRWREARWAALPLIGAAAAHHLLFTLLLHNPLWASQHVGSIPLFNLLLPMYLVPAAALFLADRRGLVPAQWRVVGHGAQMLLVSLLLLSLLRQAFVGTLLTVPGLSQSEDIARSITAIALAIGFLLWGIRTGERSWRVGSLVLMIGAVAKVFLLDASGLTGLVRIASFVALGLSLIGIGWLYSRQLSRAPAN